MAILRWIEEDEDLVAALGIDHRDIAYQPQRRYPCLFPHEDGEAHDILEIIPGMTEADIQDVGEEAMADGLVVLCPAPEPTCNWHDHVREEVHKLAVLWPVRQIICSDAVEGMIDIAPISVCRLGPSWSSCFRTTLTADVTMEIRGHEPPWRLPRNLDRIPYKSKQNPEIALHDSWVTDVLRIAQPAVFRCQDRGADIHPTKLYDAHNREVSSSTQVRHFLALSYCWDEWKDEILKDKLEELSRRLRIRYFWVDRWCIDQLDDADKAQEIPRMRGYYMGSSGCLVLTGPDAKPFACLPQHDGAILSAFQQLHQNLEALYSLSSWKWLTRVWTLQEAIVSRQVIYAVQDQLIDGDYISELISYIDTASRVAGNWVGGYGCYRWDVRIPPVIWPRQFDVRQNGCFTILRTVFGGEQQYNELQSRFHGILVPLEEALYLISGRQASKKEDYIYGVLGISERGAGVSIEYGIEWPAMMDKLQRAGMITERQLAAPTVNQSGMSWLPECGSEYGPFTKMERLAAPVDRPPLSLSEQGATVTGAVFEWVKWETHPSGWDVFSTRGMPCQYGRGTICFPGTPGLTARVCLISSEFVTEERMQGTHVLLCQGVNKATRDTVAMRVSGDIERGNVIREDGYVLELYEWYEGGPDERYEGDPESLQGRQWTLGHMPPIQS